MIQAKIIKDSITVGGNRLTTFILRHPRANHADFLTHREFSRNASSSRAIPISKMRELARKNPYIPEHWGANQKGMQAFQEVPDDVKIKAREWWQRGFDAALAHHEEGEKLGLAKQVVNRYVEPYQYIEVLMSTTSMANFTWLRKHPMADYPMQKLATLALDAYMNSMPTFLPPGAWHLPFITDEEAATLDLEVALKISTGRCARISYLTHEGTRDISEDIRLHDDLVHRTTLDSVWDVDPVHASPSEHPCMAVGNGERFGNMIGWKQYRKFLPFEAGPPIDKNCLLCGVWEGAHVTTCPNNKNGS